MSLGALPTGFTPAASCLTSGAVFQVHTTIAGATPLSMVYDEFGPPPNSDCFPPNYNPASTAYYSPGLCPSGYSVASQGTKAIGSATETTQVCCPSVFDFTTQTTGITQGHSFLSTMLCYHAYTGTGSMAATVTSLSGEKPGSTMITFREGAGAINAYGIVVRFQSNDFASTTSASVSSGKTSFVTTPTATSASGAPASSSAEAGSGGLSTGASIGIGLSVGMVALGAVAGGLWLFFRNRKRRRLEGYGLQHEFPAWDAPPQEMEAVREPKMMYAHEAAQELQGREEMMEPQELDGREQVREEHGEERERERRGE